MFVEVLFFCQFPIDMASKTWSNHQSVSKDTVPIHELLLSIGQLKFSLKALMAVQLQNACVSLQEPKVYDLNAFMDDSNKILENILNEVVSARAISNKCRRSETGLTESLSLSSVQELSMTHELLKSELQKIQDTYYSALSTS